MLRIVKMQLNIKNRLKTITPYVDKPNSSKDNIGEPLGKLLLILLFGALLYLVITGIPTIIIAFNMFIRVTTGLFNIQN